MNYETDLNLTKTSFRETYPHLSRLMEEKNWKFENFYDVVKEKTKEAQRNFYAIENWPCILVYQFGFYYYSDGTDFGFFSCWQPECTIKPFGFLPSLKEIIIMDASVDICSIKADPETHYEEFDFTIEIAQACLEKQGVYPLDIDSVFRRIDRALI